MSNKTTIEWTDWSWNPTQGCTKISQGCKNCYAASIAHRFTGVPGNAYQNGFGLTLRPDRLYDPLTWKEPRLVFVNSMSDLFHEAVSDDYIEQVVQVMLKADQHVFQVLTKRAERMQKLLSGKLRYAADAPHIWWGVTVENKREGLPRVDLLRKTPVAMRFLSIEPLLEDLGQVDLTDIHWVIVGGESGANARCIHPDWVRSLQAQCNAAGASFFFKQWGTWGPYTAEPTKSKSQRKTLALRFDGTNYLGSLADDDCPLDVAVMQCVGKKAAGRELDGRTLDEMPYDRMNALL